METQNLTRAHQELFRRSADECFDSLEAIGQHVREDREKSTDRWYAPREIQTKPDAGPLMLEIGTDGAYLMNDWSFSQLCRFAQVNKDTVNRLSPETADRVFRETLPRGNRPFQLLTAHRTVRSIHGVSYTRLWNADLVGLIEEFATDFQPPQKASGGGTGLYAGEQDMFCFLIDPTGWAEIEGEAFAPGFFLWNSEVGRRSVGLSTFWFQAVCANHIVWDAVDVRQVIRKHTTNVHKALSAIRQTLEQLIQKRDERRDAFVRVLANAMQTKYGDDAEEAQKLLTKSGFGRELAKRAIQLAREKGAFTLWAVVDALTRLARESEYAGSRTEADQKASSLLALAAA